MFKHILVPTDGSELSAKCIENAVKFAAEVKAKITFVTAMQEVILPYLGLGTISDPNLMQEAKERIQSDADEFLAKAEEVAKQAGVACELMSSTGEPWYQIIQAAEEKECDAIFMASHGRSGVTGILLGSETQKVLVHSKIPVLVYR